MTYRGAITAIFVLAVAAGAISLGRWQLRRLHQRRLRNAAFVSAGARPPLDLVRDWRDGQPIDSGRRLLARGHFDTTAQMILRGRAQDEGPGLQVVTPFVLDSSSRVLWVLRGFVRSPDAATPPDTIPGPASGEITISGIAFDLPAAADRGQPLLHNGTTTWKRLDRNATNQLKPASLPVYLLLSDESKDLGRLPVVAPPPVTDGPHLSYALQWFGIALAALVFGFIALWRGGRALTPRRAAP